MNLKTHIRTLTGEKLFSWINWKLWFLTNRHLKLHVQTHPGDTWFNCIACRASFLMNNCLKKHIERHTRTNLFDFKECGYVFSRVADTYCIEPIKKCKTCVVKCSTNGHLKNQMLQIYSCMNTMRPKMASYLLDTGDTMYRTKTTD